MEDRIRFALEKLLNIAHQDSGQGRRGKFSACLVECRRAWRLRPDRFGQCGSGGVRGHGDDLYLARGEEDVVYPDEYSSEIEQIIARWRPQAAVK